MLCSPAWLADHPGPSTALGDPGMPPRARHGHLVVSNSHDAWDALPGVTAPAPLLHGGQDRLTPPDDLPLLAARIPRVTSHVFPGARHAYFEKCRTASGALVSGFLSAGP
ncbi:alpha/beta fold hydrolase [Streptomyces griseiscabiei]|uniref:alpha/beta fold hydrolase n=1 Tax=Streptomyces griseiscabiei TaxID=2993540 RepID=UPI002958AAA9|nr:hypothetical protein [Streptomyces griseiscabiei]